MKLRSIILIALGTLNTCNTQAESNGPIVKYLTAEGKWIIDNRTDAELWPGFWKDGTNGLRIGVYFGDTDTLNPYFGFRLGSRMRNSLGSFFKIPSMQFSMLKLNDGAKDIYPKVRSCGFYPTAPVTLEMKGRMIKLDGKKLEWERIGFVTNSSPMVIYVGYLATDFGPLTSTNIFLTFRPIIYERAGTGGTLHRVDLDEITLKVPLEPRGLNGAMKPPQ